LGGMLAVCRTRREGASRTSLSGACPRLPYSGNNAGVACKIKILAATSRTHLERGPTGSTRTIITRRLNAWARRFQARPVFQMRARVVEQASKWCLSAKMEV
jgi:hypothetical protein